jgi:hypothetical protein
MPSRCAAQAPRQGQSAQAGRRGVHTVAPRSNSAWAKSPGRARAGSCSIQRWASASRRRFAPGSGSVTACTRDVTAPHCRRSGTTGRSKAMAATAAAV